MAERLPVVGGDIGSWGSILNGFLGVSLNPDGTLKATALALTAINVKSAPYNAVGDGSTDDTAAISSALAAVPVSGGIVIFPPGTYIHSTRLSPKSGTMLYGYGATVKAKNGISNGYDQMGFEVLSVSNIRFIGLTYDGNRAARTTGGSAFGIYIANSSNVSFMDLIIQNSAWDGMEIAYTNPLDATTRCFQISGVNVSITNSVRNNLSVDGGVGVCFTRGKFTSANGSAPEAGIDVEADNATIFNRDVWFLDCECSGNTGDGLTFAQFNQGGGAIGGRFTNNGGYGISINTAGTPDNDGVLALYPEAQFNTTGQIRRLNASSSVLWYNYVSARFEMMAGAAGNSFDMVPAAANTANKIVIRDASGNFIANVPRFAGLNFGAAGINGFFAYGTDLQFYGPGSGDLQINAGNGAGSVLIQTSAPVAIATFKTGVQIGAPVGGDKGAGSLNVATDIYKNNTAYTNPDYVFSAWRTNLRPLTR